MKYIAKTAAALTVAAISVASAQVDVFETKIAVNTSVIKEMNVKIKDLSTGAKETATKPATVHYRAPVKKAYTFLSAVEYNTSGAVIDQYALLFAADKDIPASEFSGAANFEDRTGTNLIGAKGLNLPTEFNYFGIEGDLEFTGLITQANVKIGTAAPALKNNSVGQVKGIGFLPLFCQAKTCKHEDSKLDQVSRFTEAEMNIVKAPFYPGDCLDEEGFAEQAHFFGTYTMKCNAKLSAGVTSATTGTTSAKDKFLAEARIFKDGKLNKKPTDYSAKVTAFTTALGLMPAAGAINPDGSTVEDDKPLVEAVRAAYNALPYGARKDVLPADLTALENAEAAVAVAEEAALIAEFMTAYGALPGSGTIVANAAAIATAEAKIDAALEAFDALSETAQGTLGTEKDALDAAVAELAAAKKAAPVVLKIQAIVDYWDDELSYASAAALVANDDEDEIAELQDLVDAARLAFDALDDAAAEAKVTNLSDLTDAETALPVAP